MVMMAVFAVFRLDTHELVLRSGNLVVAIGLLVGGVAVALNKPFSLPVGLASAVSTAIMGIVGFVTLGSEPRFLRLPGYPLIWVVIGLYIAFRLAINHQHQQRAQRARNAAASAGTDDAEGHQGGEG